MLPNGFYKAGSNSIQVVNGVVTAVTACSGGGATYAQITAQNPSGANIAVVYRSDLYATNTIFSNTIGATVIQMIFQMEALHSLRELDIHFIMEDLPEQTL